MKSATRPGFWSSIFRKQPVENGVADPVEDDLARARERMQRVSNDLSESMSALLADLQQRQKRKEGQHRV